MIVLTFHNVLAHAPSAFNLLARKEWLSLQAFTKQLDAIVSRYRIVPLTEIAAAIANGETLPPGTCALTFDDGNLGAYRYAAPLLEERALPATFFVVTGRLDDPQSEDAFDRLEAILTLTQRDALDLSACGEGLLSSDCAGCKLACYETLSKRLRIAPPAERTTLLSAIEAAAGVPAANVAAHLSHEAYRSMAWDEARELVRRGFAVGSHGRTHVPLSSLSEGELEDEVAGSYRTLGTALGTDGPFAFSYPFGKAKHVSERAAASVRVAGYSCALTMVQGDNSPGTDLFLLQRVVYKRLKKLSP